MNPKEAYEILMECLNDLHKAVRRYEETYEWESDYHSALYYLLTERINKELHPDSWQKQLVKFEDRVFKDQEQRIDVTISDEVKNHLVFIEVKCDSLKYNEPNLDLKDFKKLTKAKNKNKNSKAVFLYCGGYRLNPKNTAKGLTKLVKRYSNKIDFILLHEGLNKLYKNDDIYKQKLKVEDPLTNRSSVDRNISSDPNSLLNDYDIYLLDLEWPKEECLKLYNKGSIKQPKGENGGDIILFHTRNKKQPFLKKPSKIEAKLNERKKKRLLLINSNHRTYKSEFIGFSKLKFGRKYIHYTAKWDYFKDSDGSAGIRFSVPNDYVYEYFGVKRIGKRNYPHIYRLSSKRTQLLNFLQQNVSNWDEIIKKIKSSDSKPKCPSTPTPAFARLSS